MKQNRKNCAAIYTEEEYEELVLEAYWQAKDKHKQPNNRYRFRCIHCGETGKDKNTISYHRMFNQCKGYRGEKPLKMYPTWEPSNHGEKQRIALKYGKASSPTAGHSQSPSGFPPPLDLGGSSGSALVPVPRSTPVPALASDPAEHGTVSRKRKLPTRTAAPPVAARTRTPAVEVPPSSPPRNRQNLAVRAPPKAPKSPTCSRQRTKTMKPARRIVIVSSEEEQNSGNSSSESDSSSAATATNSQRSEDGSFRVVKHDRLQESSESAELRQPAVAEVRQPAVAELRLPPIAEQLDTPILDGDYIHAGTAHEGFVLDMPESANLQHPIVVHDIQLMPESPPEEQHAPAPLQPQPLTRHEVGKKAYEEATTLYSVENQVGPPPSPIPVNGLYVLIRETEEPWVPKSLLEDPDGCMQILHKQLDNGTLRKRAQAAFGQWYLYGSAKVI